MPEWLKAPWVQEVWQTTHQRLPTIGIALGILIGGWLVAYIIQLLIFAGLKRTTIDDKIAELAGVDTGGDYGPRVERMIAKTFYYLLLAFVLVAFFGYLKIEAVTKPLLTVLNSVAGAVPNLLKALVIGFGGFLLATGVRKLIIFTLTKAGFESRMKKLAGEEEAPVEKEPEPTKREGKKKRRKKPRVEAPLTTTLADVAYWFIIIVVAIPVLESLQIGALAVPLSTAFSIVTTYLPKIGGAVVLLVIGYVLARIVRALLSGILERVGLDKAMVRLGFERVTGEHKLSGIIGTIVMAFILLQFAISAVGRLDIEEISAPLGLMLEQIYAYLPKLLVGLVLMAIGVLVARVVGSVAARLLAAMGFNTLMVHIGLFKRLSREAAVQEKESKEMVERRRQPASGEGADEVPEMSVEGPDELIGDSAVTKIQTPADIAGVVVGAIVVLLFLRQVLATLQMEGLAKLLDGFLGYLPNILVAVVVLGAGMWAGSWARKRVNELTASSQDRLVRSLGVVAHVAIVAFAAMVSLQQLGVGQQLIAIAFAVVLGAVCLAGALAFGLGGRDVAGRVIQKEYERRGRSGGGVERKY